MSRLSASLILVSLLGWLAFWIISSLNLFEQAPELGQFALGMGLTISAITLVSVLARFLLHTVLNGAFQVKPSGLVSAIVYSTLSLGAGIALLSQLGVDVGAILTTSAIVGAVVGLSMQSTLGSIISGMSMSAEPLLKIGSAIYFENRTVFIEQKTWRHVIGRRLDNIRVIIPNAMLANMPILVLPEDGPTRFDVFLHLPPDIPPQRVTDLLSHAFTDVEHMDATRAIMVTPIETQPDVDSIKYRIRLWARTYSHVTILQGEVLRRAWYVLERANIRQPRHQFYASTPPRQIKTSLIEEIIRSAHPEDLDQDTVFKTRQYRFAPSEVLRFPQSEKGRSLIIIQGQVHEYGSSYLNPMEHGRSARPHLPTMSVQKLSISAIVRKIADLLAMDTGPVAEQLVRDAMSSAKDLEEFVALLSENVHDEARREVFLKTSMTLLKTKDHHSRWTISKLLIDASGQISPIPQQRAISEVLAITFQSKR